MITQTTITPIVRSDNKKLNDFLDLLQAEQNDRLREQFPILHEAAIKEGAIGYQIIGFDEGPRFWRVWTADSTSRDLPPGKSVKYFVERATGIIFGAKSWKVYNPIHEYGTLDTIHEWQWGAYYGSHKQGKSSIVPKENRK